MKWRWVSDNVCGEPEGRVGCPEIRVERGFHFSCSCGAKTVTSSGAVTCGLWGKSLSIRKASKQQRISGESAYYGVVLPADQPEPSVNGQCEPAAVVFHGTEEINNSSGTKSTVEICDLARVGRFKPDGVTLHPHAGVVGRVKDIFNGHAHVVVKGGHYGICVSVSCLEPQMS
jgi:hypothetical protein